MNNDPSKPNNICENPRPTPKECGCQVSATYMIDPSPSMDELSEPIPWPKNDTIAVYVDPKLIFAVKEKAGQSIRGEQPFKRGEMSASGVVEWLILRYLNPEKTGV